MCAASAGSASAPVEQARGTDVAPHQARIDRVAASRGQRGDPCPRARPEIGRRTPRDSAADERPIASRRPDDPDDTDTSTSDPTVRSQRLQVRPLAVGRTSRRTDIADGVPAFDEDHPPMRRARQQADVDRAPWFDRPRRQLEAIRRIPDRSTEPKDEFLDREVAGVGWAHRGCRAERDDQRVDPSRPRSAGGHRDPGSSSPRSTRHSTIRPMPARGPGRCASSRGARASCGSSPPIRTRWSVFRRVASTASWERLTPGMIATCPFPGLHRGLSDGRSGQAARAPRSAGDAHGLCSRFEAPGSDSPAWLERARSPRNEHGACAGVRWRGSCPGQAQAMRGPREPSGTDAAGATAARPGSGGLAALREPVLVVRLVDAAVDVGLGQQER